MNFKFLFFVILSFIVSAILIISSFIVFNKAHNTISLVDSNIHLKSHHSSLSDRITKFYILNLKDNLEHITLGTSSTWVFDPEIIQKKYNFNSAINLSQGGAKLVEHYKFISWIIENKKSVKEILINLEPYSFNELTYNRMPLELEKNIFDKVTSFFSFLTFKDATKIFLTNNNFLNEINQIDQIGVNDKYFYSGMRYYPEYFQRKSDPSLLSDMVNSLKSSKIEYLREPFENKSFQYLKKILKLCEKNNIKVRLIFDPVSYIFLQSNDYEYLYTELKIVKKIVNELNQEVLYFNNLNRINLNLKIFEDGHSHYNYDAALEIKDEIFFDKYFIGVKINEQNFDEIIRKLNLRIKSKKLYALY